MMDVDDDDKCMNAAAVRTYWLLRHAQHTCDLKIFISSTHFPKTGLGSAIFQHSRTGYIEIAVFVLIDFFVDFSQNFLERALFVLKDSITISIRKIGAVEPVTLKKPCLFHTDFNQNFLRSGTWFADFNHDCKEFQSRFSAQWNTPFIHSLYFFSCFQVVLYFNLDILLIAMPLPHYGMTDFDK